MVGARALVGELVMDLWRRVLCEQGRTRTGSEDRRRHREPLEEADGPLTSA